MSGKLENLTDFSLLHGAIVKVSTWSTPVAECAKPLGDKKKQ
jgi:hypothetical protein